MIKIMRATEVWQIAGSAYVRIHVMAKKYNITPELEFDGHDCPDTKYILATDDDFPVATARMFAINESEVKVGRVIVLPEYRHRGIGSGVVKECEAWARELGFRKLVLESRDNKVDFYHALGYSEVGDFFFVEPFRCIRMEKAL